MEQFYEQLRLESPEITAERIEAKREIIDRLIIEGFADTLYGKKDGEYKEQRYVNVKALASNLQLNGMQKVVFAIIQKYIDIILSQDIANAPFTLIGLEQKGSVSFNFDANGKEQAIKLFGIIDRVDLKDGIYRIVDYKSGGDKLKYSTIEDCFDTDGGNINKALVQTLFYTHVYEQLSNNENVEPNLYVVRTMSKEGIFFTGKEGLLSGEILAREKQLYLTALREKLKELFDYSIPFKASKNPSNYVYSIYTTLFGG